MPLITCEMRWFHEGALPGEVESWFHHGHQPAAALWREDRYLLPGVADMGIKRREGRLEIKGRTAKLGVHAVAPEIEGNAERWCKWSYDAAIAEGFRGCLQSQETIVVGKGRVQRHFLLEPGGGTQETAPRDLTRRGFSLELTRIRLPASNSEHWSLGIEAAPDDAALLADLLCVLREVLAGFPIPLPRVRSRSYPRWLLDLDECARPPKR
jgi:hypothetical protein